MKQAIICEKRPIIASFVKQTLHLAGYNTINVISEFTELSAYTSPYTIFTDMEFAYLAKRTSKELLSDDNILISFYQVENNQVTGFWNEGNLSKMVNETSTNIFIRSRGRLEKVSKKDILFIESDKKYCTISTLNKKYVLRTALWNSKKIDSESKELYLL